MTIAITAGDPRVFSGIDTLEFVVIPAASPRRPMVPAENVSLQPRKVFIPRCTMDDGVRKTVSQKMGNDFAKNGKRFRKKWEYFIEIGKSIAVLGNSAMSSPDVNQVRKSKQKNDLHDSHIFSDTRHRDCVRTLSRQIQPSPRNQP